LTAEGVDGYGDRRGRGGGCGGLHGNRSPRCAVF
jgi:hypothetical protein